MLSECGSSNLVYSPSIIHSQKLNSNVFLKVWTGNDNCKEETWEECKPYTYKANFTKDMVKCVNSTNIPYCNNCKTILKPITTQSITCKPKSAVQCKPVTREICSYGEYFL